MDVRNVAKPVRVHAMPLLTFAHPPRAFLFGHCEWFFCGMKRARDDRESNAGDYQLTFHNDLPIQ